MTARLLPCCCFLSCSSSHAAAAQCCCRGSLAAAAGGGGGFVASSLPHDGNPTPLFSRLWPSGVIAVDSGALQRKELAEDPPLILFRRIAYVGRLIRVGGGVTRGGQWESGPHEWAGAGPTTSTLVAVPPVADPLGPPSTSTVGDVFPALTPPHHLAGCNHDRPEGRRGGCA